MRKFGITAFTLSVILAFSSVVGCSNKTSSSSSTTTTSQSDNNNNDSSRKSNSIVNSNEELNANEINVGISEEANQNQTGFILNSVIDSGEKTENNEKYIYLNVTIKNTSDTDYSLNTLNNFYILLPDGTESHFDIRTQIFAQKNYKGYQSNPIIVPANGEFTGYIGGFMVDESITNFTVCFFPTQNDERNKENVIKCPVTASDIVSTPADLIG